MMPLIELKAVCRHFWIGDKKVDVLKNISLSIFSGEMVAIMGPSGSGKSTLMNILGGLDRPSGGTYKLADMNITTLNDNALAGLRRERFGFVFQRYQLMASLTAAQNVEVPAIYAGHNRRSRRSRAENLLVSVGLEERKDYFPSQLSGGQQQRVSIARALMNGGQIILADEPTGALDSKAGQDIMLTLRQLCDQGHTVILVTHDATIAGQADRVIVLRDGAIINDGKAAQGVITRIPDRREPGFKAPLPLRDISLLPWFASSLTDALLMAWRVMRARKLRTFLTMLGIVIGIASVVILVLLGDAAQGQVLKNLHNMGTDSIAIYPGSDIGDEMFQRSLTCGDITLIRKQPWVQAVSATVSSSERVRFGSRDMQASISGVSSDYSHLFELSFSEGSFFTDAQVEAGAQVAILDSSTRRRLFPTEADVTGKVMLIGKIPVTIVGVVKEKPSAGGEGLHIWLPWTTVAARLTGTGWLNSVTVKLRQGAGGAEAEKKLTNLLVLYHGRKDFYIRNSDTIRKSVEKTTGTFRLFLTLIASVSLVVGGIGVMNIMLVSVTERTREIGIRMAVGARARDVLLQFLIESILVCLTGGAAGLLLSAITAQVLKYYLPGWDIHLSASSMLTAFFCAMLSGVISGWLPARIAAKQNPVVSLARE
ncbi:ABC transporter permease [Pantoea agglomerans]|uniref:ABC transporter permease n=1 Tax=Enterobacter agglomerans TaxID=549 RepID=UPI00241372BD|nr:ABC transporter permease [Pantoea agglomerans]